MSAFGCSLGFNKQFGTKNQTWSNDYSLSNYKMMTFDDAKVFNIKWINLQYDTILCYIIWNSYFY